MSLPWRPLCGDEGRGSERPSWWLDGASMMLSKRLSVALDSVLKNIGWKMTEGGQCEFAQIPKRLGRGASAGLGFGTTDGPLRVSHPRPDGAPACTL